MALTFDQPGLLAALDAATPAELDALDFGVVGMRPNGFTVSYNALEVRLAGLPASKVIERHFFSQVAPCMNGARVAGRFANEAALDEIIDYVLTLRMQPTRARLRLLKDAGYARMFLAIERR